MKKLFILGILSTTLLYGCSEDEFSNDSGPAIEESIAEGIEEATAQKEHEEDIDYNIEEEDTEENYDLNEMNDDQSDFETIIIDNIAGDDVVTDFQNDDGEIHAIIEMAENELDGATLAETNYSRISDAMLMVDGWDTLTIDFAGIGEISFDRYEAESNEYGDYFPTGRIIKKLSMEH